MIARLILTLIVHDVSCGHTMMFFVKTDLSTNFETEIPRDFVGHTIDASMVTKREWSQIDLEDPVLLTYLKGLAPTYLRFGGIYSDHTTFVEGSELGGIVAELPKNRTKTGSVKPFPETGKLRTKDGRSKRKSHAPANITTADIDKIVRIANLTQSRLLFCLNSHQKVNGVWDPENSLKLIDYVIEKKVANLVDWSIGNEPKFRHGFTGEYIGNAVSHLRAELDRRGLENSKIVAPDVSNVGKSNGLLFLEQTMRTARENLSVISFHQYYLDGKTMSWEDQIQPRILDVLEKQIRKVDQLAMDYNYTKDSIWLSETGSSYGGGKPGVSRGWAAALGFADKIGMSSYLGIGRIIRQSLFGGSYSLLNVWDNYEPSAEYWIAFLFRKLGGRRTKTIRSFPTLSTLRCYCFERTEERHSTISAMFLNLHNATDYLIRFEQKRLILRTREDYIIGTDGDPSVSRRVLVNGVLLEMKNFTLPEVHPLFRDGDVPLLLKPLQMAIVEFQFNRKKKLKDSSRTGSANSIDAKDAADDLSFDASAWPRMIQLGIK